MINNISDKSGSYVGLASQSIATSNVTGDYFIAGKNNVFTLNIGELADTKTCKIDILKAKTRAGGGAAAITDQDGSTTATVTVTGRAKAAVLEILVDTVTNGKTIILATPFADSVTYTKAAVTDTAAQEFADADGLAACINVDQSDVLTATAVGTDVTVKLADPERGGWITESGVQETAKLITKSISSMVRVTVEPDALGVEDDYYYIAPKVTTTATVVVGVTYERDVNKQPATGNCGTDLRIK